MQIKNLVVSKWNALGAGVLSLVVSGAAMADTTDLTTAVTTELTGGKTMLYALGAAAIALFAVLFIIRTGKKAV